ncbi:MAG: hypothetical protein KF766_01535 [Rhodocyclaceae bacterium]|nr:hypothetical protein [Rhodocyclaceae bacterium]
MKKLSITAIAASLVLAMPALAEEPRAASMPDARMMQQMQGNVETMQKQLDRLGKATTTDERQKIMTEYMQTMQENMGMARGMQSGMSGCPMMQGGMGMMGGQGGMGMMGGQGGMGMMSQGSAGGGDMMAKRMEMMEKRMDMMQMMMQGGMKMHQGTPAKPGK